MLKKNGNFKDIQKDKIVTYKRDFVFKSFFMCGLNCCLAFLLSPHFSSLTKDGNPEDQMHLGAFLSIMVLVTVTNIILGRLLFLKIKMTPKILLAILVTLLLALPVAIISVTLSCILSMLVALPFIVFAIFASVILREVLSFSLDEINDYITYFILLASFTASCTTITFSVLFNTFSVFEDIGITQSRVKTLFFPATVGLINMTVLNFADNFPEIAFGMPLAGFISTIPMVFQYWNTDDISVLGE